MIWADCTSYSKGDTIRRPKAWSCTVEDLRIVVTEGHIAYPGQWIMHCFPWFETLPLGSSITTADKAKERAITVLRQRVNLIANALKERAPT